MDMLAVAIFLFKTWVYSQRESSSPRRILNWTFWMSPPCGSWRASCRSPTTCASIRERASITSGSILLRRSGERFHRVRRAEPHHLPISWIPPNHVDELLLGQLPVGVAVIAAEDCFHLGSGEMGRGLDHLHFADKSSMFLSVILNKGSKLSRKYYQYYRYYHQRFRWRLIFLNATILLNIFTGIPRTPRGKHCFVINFLTIKIILSLNWHRRCS